MTTPLVTVRGLRVEAPDGAPVLDSVHLEVADGGAAAIVGESGAGKTTLALTLLGATGPGLRIAAGHVDVAGIDARNAGRAAIRRLRSQLVAHLAQDPAGALNPTMRLGTQLADRITGRRPPATELAELLAAAGLPPDPKLLRRYPHQLSGGQAQRAGLALALARRPRLLVLDEPTAALDTVTRRDVLALLHAHRRRTGCALLLITHDLPLAADLADTITVLRDGTVVASGPTTEVLCTPTGYAAQLVAAYPEPAARRPADAGAAPALPRLRRPPAAPTTAGGVVTARGLTVHHHTATGRIVAADHIDLDLTPGTVLALVGASGAGKTSVARALVGLHTPAHGHITLDGQPLRDTVAHRSLAQRAAIQLVPQDPTANLNPYRRIRDSIARPLRRLHGLDRADAAHQADDLLAQVHLPTAVGDRRPHDLSGGERQRAVLARALAARPRLLVCDEPTASLDTTVQAAIADLLDELRARRRLAILLITHDLGIAARLADTIAVLHHGRITEHAPTNQLLDHPTTEPARALLAAAPSLTASLARIPARAP